MNGTSFYVASRYQDKAEARRVRDMLLAKAPGSTCTARWIDGENECMTTPEKTEWACLDRNDVLLADVLVLVNPTFAHRTGTGGRHVETGVAVATGKPILLLGENENIFHRLPQVQVCKDDDELLARFLLSGPGHPGDAYQRWTATLARYPGHGQRRLDSALYPALGLSGELGEYLRVLLEAAKDAIKGLREPTVAADLERLATLNEVIQTLEEVAAACAKAEALKRPIRDGKRLLPTLRGPTDAERDRLKSEGGDGKWYLERGLDEVGVSSSECDAHNVVKLEGRRKRNTLHGSGENR